MSFLYEYMTEDELYMESLIATSRSNLEKLNSKFDKLMLEHKLNILRIDSKIVMESGTINDLETLYLAEAEEVKKESKGILGSIIEQVKKLC